MRHLRDVVTHGKDNVDSLRDKLLEHRIEALGVAMRIATLDAQSGGLGVSNLAQRSEILAAKGAFRRRAELDDGDAGRPGCAHTPSVTSIAAMVHAPCMTPSFGDETLAAFEPAVSS